MLVPEGFSFDVNASNKITKELQSPVSESKGHWQMSTVLNITCFIYCHDSFIKFLLWRKKTRFFCIWFHGSAFGFYLKTCKVRLSYIIHFTKKTLTFQKFPKNIVRTELTERVVMRAEPTLDGKNALHVACCSNAPMIWIEPIVTQFNEIWLWLCDLYHIHVGHWTPLDSNLAKIRITDHCKTGQGRVYLQMIHIGETYQVNHRYLGNVYVNL